jgi:hypothetical protein
MNFSVAGVIFCAFGFEEEFVFSFILGYFVIYKGEVGRLKGAPPQQMYFAMYRVAANRGSENVTPSNSYCLSLV